MGRWYFVASYISLAMAVLLAVEVLQEKFRVRVFKILLLLIVITGAVSTPYFLNYEYPKSLVPMVDVAKEFEQLEKPAIIGDFWNSYIYTISDPDEIVATAHDQSFVRNQKFVDMVFERENIYVIKDMWMQDFPDTLEQFGYMLLKIGQPFEMGRCEVSQYQRISYLKKLFPDQFHHLPEVINMKNESGKGNLIVKKDFANCVNKYVIYGPYIRIGKGKYSARINLEINNFEDFPDNMAVVKVDIAADWGTTILAEKEIFSGELVSKNFDGIYIDFENDKRYENLEVRVFNYGHADVQFQSVVINERL